MFAPLSFFLLSLTFLHFSYFFADDFHFAIPLHLFPFGRLVIGDNNFNREDWPMLVARKWWKSSYRIKSFRIGTMLLVSTHPVPPTRAAADLSWGEAESNTHGSWQGGFLGWGIQRLNHSQALGRQAYRRRMTGIHSAIQNMLQSLHNADLWNRIISSSYRLLRMVESC